MAGVAEVDGHIPNYVNPETQVPTLLAVQISLTALALVIVVLRLYTRYFIRNMLTAEDWVAAASMLLCLVSNVVMCVGVLGGTGLHYYDIPPRVDTSISAATSFANQVFYQPILQLTRISILLFYISSLGRDIRLGCIGLVVMSVLMGIACTVVEFVQCQPPYMLWTGTRPASFKCINQIDFFRITGLINLVLDLVTLVVPLPVVWALNARVKTRLVLCGIFSVGLVTIAAEVARLVIWYRTNDGNRTSKDASWNRVNIVNWSTVEYTTAIMCASLPHLKALVAIILPGFFESAIGSSYAWGRSKPVNTASYGAQSNKRATAITSRGGITAAAGQSVWKAGHHHGGLHTGSYGHNSFISSADRRTAERLDDHDAEDFALETLRSGAIWRKTEVEVHSMPMQDVEAAERP